MLKRLQGDANWPPWIPLRGPTEQRNSTMSKIDNEKWNRRGFLRNAGWIALALGGVARLQMNASDPDPVKGAILDLVFANRILAKHGILDGFGHVSVRHPINPARFFLANGIAPGLVKQEDIVKLDLSGQPVNPGERSYGERFIHSEIYKSRTDVNAIVHHHSPSIIQYGVTGEKLRAVYHMAAFVGEGIPVFEIRKLEPATDLLVSNARRGEALAKVLADKPACLMRGHGAVVLGTSISAAVGRCIYLDLSARIQTEIRQSGRRANFLSDQEVREINKRQDWAAYARAWAVWKAEIIKADPTLAP